MKTNKSTDRVAAEDYLKLPYTRQLVRESDGSWVAEIVEFPNCFAVGDSEADALASLNEIALAWIDSMVATGQAIPKPTEKNDFSGKLVLRLPRSLHKKAAQAAERDGVSLNQFIVSSVAEQVGASQVASRRAPHVLTQTIEFASQDTTGFYSQHFMSITQLSNSGTKLVPAAPLVRLNPFIERRANG